MSDPHPDVLQAPPPAMTTDLALAAAREHWGIPAAAARRLDAERDANYVIDDAYVLKVSNQAEGRAAVEMETGAIAFLRQVARDIPVPEQLPTVHGDRADPRSAIAQVVDADGAPSWARLAPLLRGRGLEGRPIGAEDAYQMGAMSARVECALEGFFHAGGGRVLDWDIRRLPAIAPDDGPLAEVARRVAPALDRTRHLPAGINHCDLTLTNVLMDGETLCGVIDFGDMHHTALICDFAVTLASVLRNTAPDQQVGLWELAAATIDGYQRVRLLSRDEAEILGELVIARLAVTQIISGRRADRFAENHDYIAQYDESNARTLGELTALVPGELAGRMLRLAGLGYVSSRPRTGAVSTGQPSTPIAGSAGGPPADDDLLRRRRTVMGGPLAPLFYRTPLHIVRGEGPWLYTSDGRQLLDAYNNVAVVGHGHPVVTQAVTTQLAVLNTHSRYLHESIVTLAERVLATMPAELDTCLFTTSGTEANELAWRLATAYTGGTSAVIAEHAYHGSTRWMADLSPNEWPPGYRPPHVATFPAPRHLDEATGYAAAWDRITAAGQRVTDAGGAPALVLADGMFTSEGVLDAPSSFFRGMADAARQIGALYLADEVQAGYGRTGPKLWRFAAADVVPDLVSLGKPMGNGFPLAALVTRADIAAALAKDYEYFSTFAATPTAAAAGLAVLDVLQGRRLPERAVEIGDYLAGRLRDLADETPVFGEIRHRGLLIGIDLVQGAAPAPRPWARSLLENLVGQGVLAGLTGPDGAVLKVRPPLVWTRKHADLFLAALRRAVAATPQDAPHYLSGGTA